MKGLRVTKIVKEVKFEGVWGNLESKNKFPETITHKIFETDPIFHFKYRKRQNFNFYFSKVFC